jgi:hypothetical protein
MSNKEEMMSLIESLLGKESESELNSKVYTGTNNIINEDNISELTIQTIKNDV